VKIKPNGKQLVVYRVTTLCFPVNNPLRASKGKQLFKKFHKLSHVYIKVHSTTSDIGHTPAISNIFSRFKMCVLITSKIASGQYNLP
jgi:hypothetical protein